LTCDHEAWTPTGPGRYAASISNPCARIASRLRRTRDALVAVDDSVTLAIASFSLL
jgi:hypothetical protein